MFTGLFEAMAPVIERTSVGLTIGLPKQFDDVEVGSSIAISGACLTVTSLEKGQMSFDVVQETWKRTTLGSLEEGDMVNLERALKIGDRFDGHIVLGHIDGVGEVLDANADGLTISYPIALRRLIVPKGSVTVNGVSLTVVDADTTQFSVALIPETKEKTNLGILKKGDKVNLEGDVIARYVQNSG